MVFENTTKAEYVSKTFKIREDVVQNIKEVAQTLDVSEATVVRYILAEYFKEPKAYGMGFGNPQKMLPTKENS